MTGEHGIGFAKARYMPLELSAETIALMRRVKRAFDPHDILNPGKIFLGLSGQSRPSIHGGGPSMRAGSCGIALLLAMVALTHGARVAGQSSN